MKEESYKRDTKDLTDYLTKHLLHESKIFMDRVNLFFVAESLFLASYVYTICTEECGKCIGKIMPYFGVIVTLCYLFVLERQYLNIGKLMKKLIEIDEDYMDLVEERIGGSANFILGRVLPFVFLILWLLFLLKEMSC